MASKQPQTSQQRYFNRELSWLEFNQRVLNEAMDPSVPLLERVKFFAITSSNLDEFFEVRVAGMKQQIESGTAGRTADGMTAAEQFRAVTRRVRKLVDDQYRCWREQLAPALAAHGLRIVRVGELDAASLEGLDRFYREQVRPVLTPLALDPTHPFPLLLNKSLNMIVQVELAQDGKKRKRLAIVKLPANLPPLVEVSRNEGGRTFVLLGDLLRRYLDDLFAGTRVLGSWLFSVTRNSELYLDRDDTDNLLQSVEQELQKRRKGAAVRLIVEKGCPAEVQELLLNRLTLGEDDLYIVDGPLNPVRLMTLCDGQNAPELKDPPFIAPEHPAFGGHQDLFEVIRQRDVLVHHPYDSFSSVVQFLHQAANDPRVLAIKMTLYRTGGDPAVVGALMDAVNNGKQVTAVVELKARFDEARNVQWARRLEEAGVHVLYGIVGMKIHAKITLVVRQDEDGIRRYLHLSTGNYNPTTARIYTDVGLFTAHPDFGEDATNLFNLLTGICQFRGARKFIVAPFELHRRMLELIHRERDNARAGLPARIIAKMNSLVDTEIIEALYEASQAGVRIDLIVRGICCLRPGVAGLSENITVRSIVDRFLEHSRIFYFENACQPQIYIGSADWMPRNFFGRIELVFPIEDGRLRERLRSEILELALQDNVKASLLQPDGSYRRPGISPATQSVRSQMALIQRALEQAAQPQSPGGKSATRLKVRTKPD